MLSQGYTCTHKDRLNIVVVTLQTPFTSLPINFENSSLKTAYRKRTSVTPSKSAGASPQKSADNVKR